MQNLKISFFGPFTLSLGEDLVREDGERANKQWRLIKYLILNRERSVSKRELIDATFGYGAYSGRPAEALNALNAMLHRARKTLSRIGLDPGKVIVFEQNAYRFLLPDGAEVDCELFDSAAAKVFSCENLEEMKPYAMRALEIYRGFFLNKGFFDEKTRLAVEKYHDVYKRIFNIACGALRRENDFLTINEISEKADAIDPFCEDFRIERILALLSLGKVKEAEKLYLDACDFFGSRTSIIVSERFKDIGKRFFATECVSVILPEKYSDREDEIKAALLRVIGDADVKILLI